jgi:hypothetical protein
MVIDPLLESGDAGVYGILAPPAIADHQNAVIGASGVCDSGCR